MPIPNNLRPLHKKKRHGLVHRQKMARKKTARAGLKPVWMERGYTGFISRGARARTMTITNGVGRPPVNKALLSG